MSSGEVWLLVLAVVLIVVAGVLVTVEAAVGRVSRAAVEDVEGRNVGALRQIIDDRSRYVNVLLFLSSLFTVSATVIASAVAVQAFGPTLGTAWAMVVAIVVMVMVSFVVLGVAPRTLGRQHAERIAVAVARPVRLLAILLGPLTTLLILIGNAVTPGKGYREGPFTSEAELRELVDLAEADRLIEDEERQMIHSVFELGDTFAREVMVPRTEVVFIERTKTLRQAMSLALRSGFSRIPVIGDSADDVIGIVYLKDVFRRTFEHHEAEQEERVESLMRGATFVPDSKPADELLRDMQAARVHMAVVVDEYGGTAGIVTIEDILEEIVGEIADEYDTAAPEVIELGDGCYRVSSRLHIDDLAEVLAIDIDADEEGIDTVLGLIAKRLGRVPIDGAQVVVDGHRLTAEQGVGRRHRIATVLVEPIEHPDMEATE